MSDSVQPHRRQPTRLCHPWDSPGKNTRVGCHFQTINAGEGVEKRESSYTVGGNANQHSHYGEQCEDSLKTWKQNCHTTQQSHCWANIPRKSEFKETHVPQCSSQHCLQQLGHESNLNVHQVMNVVVHMHNGILLRYKKRTHLSHF